MDDTAGQIFEVLIISITIGAILLLPSWWRARDRSQLLRTVAACAERGAPLTPEAIRVLPGGRDLRAQHVRDLRRGVMLTGLGLGLFVLGVFVWALVATFDPPASVAVGLIVASFGALPAIMGLTLIALSRIGKGETD